MITPVTITVRPEDEKNQNVIQTLIIKALKEKDVVFDLKDITPVFVKKSIDARHGRVKILLRYDIYIGEKPLSDDDLLPKWQKADGKHQVIIVGSGPAGLYAALRLLEDGIKPVIVERGSETAARKKDIAEISKKNKLNANSNYCYGEGGAGTFSDGKLFTRSTKRGDIGRIHRIFVEFGASPNIMTDAHPHIGTDKLPGIINNMRNKIIENGGEFLFDTQCTDLITTGQADKKQVTGIKYTNVHTGQSGEVYGQAVILATGHSAIDIYMMMARTAPLALEAKTFAVGVRVEHPRVLIDNIQFHGKKMPSAAEYRLTAQENERGVYSFCMCPGGFVVPCATSPDQIVVNGMSSSGRNSMWSNAAIVVERRPEDIPEKYKEQAANDGCPALAGLYWRTWLEQETQRQGNGQKAPAQRLTDFLYGRLSQTLPATSYTPGLVSSRLDQWLPAEISSRLQAGFKDFDKSMHGFVCDDALLIATETRTSTPVRILRDKVTFECTHLSNLYPAGEGSGYSGGIGSSAMDGERIATSIIKKIKG